MWDLAMILKYQVIIKKEEEEEKRGNIGGYYVCKREREREKQWSEKQWVMSERIFGLRGKKGKGREWFRFLLADRSFVQPFAHFLRHRFISPLHFSFIFPKILVGFIIHNFFSFPTTRIFTFFFTIILFLNYKIIRND